MLDVTTYKSTSTKYANFMKMSGRLNPTNFGVKSFWKYTKTDFGIRSRLLIIKIH